MATSNKVQVIVIDETGREIPFGTKTLTQEFKDKDGKKYKVNIQEPGKNSVFVGNYTVSGTSTDPNKPPVVFAGDDITVKENTIVKIDGSVSDLDGTITFVDWFQTAGPMVSMTHDETDPTNFSFTAPLLAAGQTEEVLEFLLRARDDKQAQTEDTIRITVTKEGGPPRNVIYDSNIHGKWNNGIARIVTDKDGDTSPNGKGLFTAASGDPELRIDGQGTARLVTKPGFGRIYVCACNFNSLLEFEFNIETGSVDNMSLKLRSRHQSGGACENRFGGFGNATSLEDTDFKTESCHNNHENGMTKRLAKKLENGKWYKKRYQCKNSADNRSVEFTDWIDYNDGAGFIKIFEGKHNSPKPYYMDKPTFDNESWFWIRLNGSGSIALKNVKLTALP